MLSSRMPGLLAADPCLRDGRLADLVAVDTGEVGVDHGEVGVQTGADRAGLIVCRPLIRALPEV